MSTNTSLRVAHLSPAHGGVAVAARRLHLGLLRAGVDSQLFVSGGLQGGSQLPDVAQVPASGWILRTLDQLSKKINRSLHLPGLTHVSSLAWDFRGFEVVHLHGAGAAWFNLHALRRLARDHAIVWTMHDKHLGTGECGYPEMWGDCQKWRTGCGACPKAQAKGWKIDLTRFAFQRKQKILGSTCVTIVALNNWMLDFMRLNPLTQGQDLRLIPNGVDTDVFVPLSSSLSRAELGLPIEGRLLLSVATDYREPRKGLRELLPLLHHIKNRAEQTIGLVLVGGNPPAEVIAQLSAIMPVYALGKVASEGAMAKAYSAADFLMLTPVIDNFPSVILESLACGTPVAATAVGGIPDMVVPGQTGFLTGAGEVIDLAQQIVGVLGDSSRYQLMRVACRQKALEEYGLEIQAARHIDLYASLIQDRHK